MDNNIRYNDLRTYTEQTTTSAGVTLKDGNVDLILNLAIYKVYEKCRLLQKYDFTFTQDGAKLNYELPEDCITPISFTDKVGKSIKYNVKDSKIKYTGNLTIEILFTSLDMPEVHMTYLAAPPKFCDTDIVFSQQYLEFFMTYLNYLLHRMVGFKNIETLSISKNEWKEALADLRLEGLNYVERTNHDDLLIDNGFK